MVVYSYLVYEDKNSKSKILLHILSKFRMMGFMMIFCEFDDFIFLWWIELGRWVRLVWVRNFMDKRAKFMRKRENELGLVFRLTNITFRSQFVNHIKFYCFVESRGLFNTFKRASSRSTARLKLNKQVKDWVKADNK